MTYLIFKKKCGKETKILIDDDTSEEIIKGIIEKHKRIGYFFSEKITRGG